MVPALTDPSHDTSNDISHDIRADVAQRGTTALPSDLLVAQLDRLVELGYPALAGVSERTFRRWVGPLRPLAASLDEHAAVRRSRFPMVLVVPRALVPTDRAMSLVLHGRQTGGVGMDGARPLEDYRPIAGVEVARRPYLAVGIDLGDPALNLTCDAYLPLLQAGGRSPLTIDEGVSLAVLHPGLLRSVNAYWLMGERADDRRVPALWVSKGAPRLGWCWAGNPHDWLGAASLVGRVAPTSD